MSKVMNKFLADRLVDWVGVGVCPYCGGHETCSTAGVIADVGGNIPYEGLVMPPDPDTGYTEVYVPYFCANCRERWAIVLGFYEGGATEDIEVVEVLAGGMPV